MTAKRARQVRKIPRALRHEGMEGMDHARFVALQERLWQRSARKRIDQMSEEMDAMLGTPSR